MITEWPVTRLRMWYTLINLSYHIPHRHWISTRSYISPFYHSMHNNSINLHHTWHTYVGIYLNTLNSHTHTPIHAVVVVFYFSSWLFQTGGIYYILFPCAKTTAPLVFCTTHTRRNAQMFRYAKTRQNGATLKSIPDYNLSG